MRNKIITYLHLDKSKIILLLAFYIIFSEFIKIKAEVYILERSIEPKMLLFALAFVIAYKVKDILIIFGIIFLLFLSIFGIQMGLLIYALTFYIFLRLFKMSRSPSNE